jgi:hypothetical protein
MHITVAQIGEFLLLLHPGVYPERKASPRKELRLIQVMADEISAGLLYVESEVGRGEL